jgi:hypothetical protein
LSDEHKKLCGKCLTLNPLDAERCANCGADIRPLRDLIRFSAVTHLYRVLKPLDKPIGEGGVEEKLYDVYEGKLNSRSPRPYFIFDVDGVMSPSRVEVALERLEKDAVEEYLKPLPTSILKLIAGKLSYAGLSSASKDAASSHSDLAEILASNFLAYQAVPRLRDKEWLRSINWVEKVVNPIISFRVEKDERLKALHKSHLLRGLNMRINPHSITSTNGGTGKTQFYLMTGLNIDKATANSLIGYAKSPDLKDIFYGTIHEYEAAINIDQLESQSAPQIVRYLFNILEVGYATVSSGAAKFTVETSSIFNFSANPIGYSSDPSKSFHSLLNHLSLNPSFGRRIAFIIYGNDFKRIESKPKDEDLKEWSDKISLFRAVEEDCRKKLLEIVNSREVWTWLNQPIEGYYETVKKICEDLEDGSSVKDFILEHTAAQTRIRAGVLYAVLADNLKNIALGEYELNELLEEAQDRLPYYVQLNISSITNIAKAWSKEAEYGAETFFNTCASYLREIISAVLHHKKANPSAITEDLDRIGSYYETEDKEAYPYLSVALAKLKRSKKIDRLNEDLKRIFGFQLIKTDSKVTVEYFTIPKHVENLKLIGKYGVQTPLTDAQSVQAEAKPKEYKCSLCNSAFLSEADLNNHMKTHQTEADNL